MFKTLKDSLKFLLNDDFDESCFRRGFPNLFQKKITHTKYTI